MFSRNSLPNSSEALTDSVTFILAHFCYWTSNNATLYLLSGGQLEHRLADVCRPATDWFWRTLAFTVLHRINIVQRGITKYRTNASYMFPSLFLSLFGIYSSLQLLCFEADHLWICLYFLEVNFSDLFYLCVRVGQCDLQMPQGRFSF